MNSIEVLVFANSKIAAELAQNLKSQRSDVEWRFHNCEDLKQTWSVFKSINPPIVLLEANLPETTPKKIAHEMLSEFAGTSIYCLGKDTEASVELESILWPPESWQDAVLQILSGLSLEKLERLGGFNDASSEANKLEAYAKRYISQEPLAFQLESYSWIPLPQSQTESLSNDRQSATHLNSSANIANNFFSSAISRATIEQSVSMRATDWLVLAFSLILPLAIWLLKPDSDSILVEALQWLSMIVCLAVWLGFFATRIFIRLAFNDGPESSGPSTKS